ncbi:hypothetical protein ABEX25_28165 [Paenibacillus thiaminolyticus]|uniref:hypothetical protein n=1 Tax=Paenibacillus thiaminolyticus TaxID=49283 RepID=UPI003D2B41EF
MQQLFPLQQLLQLLPLRWLRALWKLRSLPLSTDKLAWRTTKTACPCRCLVLQGLFLFLVPGMKDKTLYII